MNETIGDRIRRLRGKVLTQRQLAEAAELSVDLVRKLEQGQRTSTSIGSLQKIARVLDVDVSELVGQPAAMPSTDPDEGVTAIRYALTPVDDLIGDQLVDDNLLTMAEASRTVDYAWGAYWNGRFGLLARILPSALPQVRASARAASSADGVRAYDLLARIYWVAGCSLVHFHHADSAFLAVRQALQSVERADDELLAATLRGSIGWQLLVQGRYDEASAVTLRTAESIAPDGDARPEHLTTYGSLILQGATIAARDHSVDEAHSLVGAAAEVADRIGGDRRDYETHFGPSQVAMQTVDVHVVTENYTGALEAARAMPRDNTLPVAARARHLADRALAHARLGHGQESLDALLTAEHMGPDWIQHQTLPRTIVSELLDSDRRAPLRGLANRLGVHE